MAAKASSEHDIQTDAAEATAANGNGTIASPRGPEPPEELPRENIFLFWPNIIGM